MSVVVFVFKDGDNVVRRTYVQDATLMHLADGSKVRADAVQVGQAVRLDDGSFRAVDAVEAD